MGGKRVVEGRESVWSKPYRESKSLFSHAPGVQVEAIPVAPVVSRHTGGFLHDKREQTCMAAKSPILYDGC